MTDTPATPPYPRVAPCRHCGRPVLRDNDGVWIHADLAYVCRDRWGATTATTAAPEPPDPTWPPSVAERPYPFRVDSGAPLDL